ncbi:Las1-like-domain-containing protein [Boeremia exigua]|uniref:Las1-like-domain-containing protein n=1 Tax=Boeremia exigua TaxID=749465 RepID=UPI001E8CABDA|nr:Las1-like-domain-containing protein [Boeremia exigua]KAH6642178.1 Las1-like-domain-containing protein [Boeremia exigua]
METYTHYIVTPWRNSQELIQLRRDLYRLHDDNVDRRQGAVNKVLAWRARKESVPLLLESTADIVDVILQDEAGTLTHNATTLLYAIAISRFITGYLDTQIDLTRDRPSWFPPGKSLQPPSSLLEVRHCIVHRHMPSLAELKRASQTALDWLWEWYWSQLEAAFGLPSAHDADNSGTGVESGVSEKLQNILKTYVKGRKQEIKAKRRSDLCTAASTALSMYNLRFSPSATTISSSTAQAALIRLLVNENQLLPADKKLGSSMSGAFLIWSPMLLSFSTLSPAFFTELLKTIIREMTSTDRRNEEREGMCDWAAHILTSADWQAARGSKERTMREEVLGDCMTELGRWNLRLAEKIVDSMDEGESELWRAILDASRSEVDGEVMAIDKTEGIETEKVMRVGGSEEKVVELPPMVELAKLVQVREPSETKEKITGPQKVVGQWKPTPIGWLPDGWDEDA